MQQQQLKQADHQNRSQEGIKAGWAGGGHWDSRPLVPHLVFFRIISIYAAAAVKLEIHLQQKKAEAEA